MKSKLLLLLAFAVLFIPSSVSAGCAFTTNASTSTVASSCSFDNTIDGIDVGPDGSSTINTGELKIAGGTLTILATQEIILGKLTLTGGVLVIIDGGKLSIGKTLWYIDKDGDSYVTSLTPALSATKPVGGIRKSFLSPLGVDCGDNDANAHPGQTAYYSVPFLNNSGVSSFDYDCSGGGTAAGEVKDPSQPTFICSTTGCASHVFTISNGFAAATACGATGTWNTYAGAVAGTCTTTVAGAGRTCPAVTTSSVAQKCH